MRVFAVALAFSMIVMEGVAFAQAPTPAAAPPAPPAPAAPVVQPRFQDGMSYAYVNVQAVASESVEGKVAAERIKVFQDQKTRDLQGRNQELQAAQQRLEQGGGVLSEQARLQLQSDIDRRQRDIQRFTEDAQEEVQALAEQVEVDFQAKLTPVIDRVAKEKQVDFVFNAAQSGLIWAKPGMDLTAEVIRAFDTPAAPPAPAVTPQ
jgi:Skp family chaperone for outer membrane proteins